MIFDDIAVPIAENVSNDLIALVVFHDYLRAEPATRFATRRRLGECADGSPVARVFCRITDQPSRNFASCSPVPAACRYHADGHSACCDS